MLKAVEDAFAKFTQQVLKEGLVILNDDDVPTRSIIRTIEQKKITYGKLETADFQLVNVSYSKSQTNFQVKIQNAIESFTLGIPGEHNALNSTAAIVILVTLGFTVEQIREVLKSFNGTKRRFEKIAEKNGKLLFDDYAHHPTEITATLTAIRNWFPDKRIITIFQPHTYSRTQALLLEFAHSFMVSDVVVLTNIYSSAREKPIVGVTGEILYGKTKQYKTSVHYEQETFILGYLKLRLFYNIS